jgi:hypothetical protein
LRPAEAASAGAGATEGACAEPGKSSGSGSAEPLVMSRQELLEFWLNTSMACVIAASKSVPAKLELLRCSQATLTRLAGMLLPATGALY